MLIAEFGQRVFVGFLHRGEFLFVFGLLINELATKLLDTRLVGSDLLRALLQSIGETRNLFLLCLRELLT